MRASTVCDKRTEIAFGIILVQHALGHLNNGRGEIFAEAALIAAKNQLEDQYVEVSNLQQQIQRPRRGGTGGM
jgi:hypothetical protein